MLNRRRKNANWIRKQWRKRSTGNSIETLSGTDERMGEVKKQTNICIHCYWQSRAQYSLFDDSISATIEKYTKMLTGHIHLETPLWRWRSVDNGDWQNPDEKQSLDALTLKIEKYELINSQYFPLPVFKRFFTHHSRPPVTLALSLRNTNMRLLA